MRILVVEDEEAFARALKTGLQQEGLSVEVAADGTTGLWLALEGDHDVIVLDVMLPGLNGFQICAELRKAEKWTPVLMLTAKDGEFDHAEALDTGADDYLSKPVSYVILLAHLRALLRRGKGARPVRLAAGDLVIDPAAHLCWRGDVPIELTSRQFALLEYLMHRKGEVVSKTEILDHVWDPEYQGDGNIVEVYIRYLRQKIDDPFLRSAIQTVRLVGYRLDASGG